MIQIDLTEYQTISNNIELKSQISHKPGVRKVRVIIHYVVAERRVDRVEILTQEDRPKDLHVRLSEDAVHVVEMRTVHPLRVAVEKALTMLELILVGGSGTRSPSVDMK